MKKPTNYDIPGCSHHDVSCMQLHQYRSNVPKNYTDNIRYLTASATQAEYNKQWLETGLCKQTLFMLDCNSDKTILESFISLLHTKLNIEKRVFMYKYTFPMIVHTYILVYTLNMQKRDIVETLYHALCVSGQNSTKQTSIPNILKSETLDNTCLSSILEHTLLLTNSVILVNCKPLLILYLTSGSLVLHWLDWF